MDSEDRYPIKALRIQHVEEMTGMKRAAIYRWVKDGKFPRPIRLGPNSSAWIEAEVEAWIRQRMAERDKK